MKKLNIEINTICALDACETIERIEAMERKVLEKAYKELEYEIVKIKQEGNVKIGFYYDDLESPKSLLEIKVNND